MPTKKVSELVALTAPAVGDLLLVIDISEPLDVDKAKGIAFTNLGKVIPELIGLVKVGFASLYDNGASGATKTIDWLANGNLQEVELTGNCTFTFTAPSKPCHLTLLLEGDGTARTLTWPATVKWLGLIGEPAWKGDAGEYNVLSMVFDGTDYLCSGAAPT